jgi:PAS domain S-box-containing protein
MDTAEHGAHLWFLESIDRINRAMQGPDDLERIFSDVLEAVLEIFSSDRVWLLCPCDPDVRSWRVVTERTRPEVPRAAPGGELAMPAGSAEVARAALESRSALLAGPGHEREVTPELAERFGVRAEMLMALHPKRDQPYFFALHQCSRPRTWTKEEQRLFEEIGHRLTDALGRLTALRSLRESERRLEMAQRLAHVGWWERDYRTGHVALSKEASRIFGMEAVDLPRWQDRWLKLIHPEDRQGAREASEIALRGGRRYDVEYRVVRPDGTVRVVHSQGDVTFDESGRPVRQFGTMQDITELRQAERELRETAQRYRTLFEKANDALFLENERDEILEVNEKACTLLGYSRDELLRMKVPDLQAPELRGQVGRVLREEVEKHGSATFEALDVHRSGRRIAVEVTNTPISYGGQQLILSIVRDVTDRARAGEELRASEARFRMFVDHATDAFFLIDAQQLRVVDVNRQACESLGHPREQLIGMHPRDFDAGLDDASIARLSERASAGETVTFETLHRRKDGTVFPVEIRVRTFREGAKHFHVALARDITERKLAEQTLRSKENELQLARTELARIARVTMLGELTASIAHEVNQPLGAIVTNAGACARWLAAKPPKIEEARPSLQAIAADARRASEVIGRIRALVKRQAAQKASLDLNVNITRVVALAEQELRRHHVAIETRLAERLPTVAGDSVQLQQVLLNLILNAIEAMSQVHDRPRQLTIVSRQDGASTVTVEVRDCGSGLDAERAERLFEPFYTTKAEGIGIGLSISRSIVEAHGGRLWATPNSPHGAVFCFSLPVAEEACS